MRLFGTNTMITLYYDFKNNREYMINVTDSRIYSHPMKWSIKEIVIVVMLFSLLMIISLSVRDLPYTHALNNLSQGYKFLFGIAGLLIGISIHFIIMSVRYSPNIRDYLRKYPQSEVEKAEDVLEKGFLRVKQLQKSLLIIFFISMGLYMVFFLFSTFIIYIFALYFFMFFAVMCTFVREMIHIIKLKK